MVNDLLRLDHIQTFAHRDFHFAQANRDNSSVFWGVVHTKTILVNKLLKPKTLNTTDFYMKAWLVHITFSWQQMEMLTIDFALLLLHLDIYKNVLVVVSPFSVLECTYNASKWLIIHFNIR